MQPHSAKRVYFPDIPSADAFNTLTSNSLIAFAYSSGVIELETVT